MQASVEGIQTTFFERCGHYPHQQHTEAFANALLRFLDDPAALPARLKAQVVPIEVNARPSRPSFAALRGASAA